MEKRYEYEPGGVLLQALTVLMCGYVLVQGLAILAGVIEIQLLAELEAAGAGTPPMPSCPIG